MQKALEKYEFLSDVFINRNHQKGIMLKPNVTKRNNKKKKKKKKMLDESKVKMSRIVKKTNKMACAPSEDRSTWASAQSDQSLRYPHEVTLGP